MIHAGPEICGDIDAAQWLHRAGGGFGLIGLAGMLQGEGSGSRRAESSLNPMARRPPHFPARAKRVIWVFTNGGPSQVDTWEYKPAARALARPFDARVRSVFQGHDRILQERGRRH